MDFKDRRASLCQYDLSDSDQEKEEQSSQHRVKKVPGDKTDESVSSSKNSNRDRELPKAYSDHRNADSTDRTTKRSEDKSSDESSGMRQVKRHRRDDSPRGESRVTKRHRDDSPPKRYEEGRCSPRRSRGHHANGSGGDRRHKNEHNWPGKRGHGGRREARDYDRRQRGGKRESDSLRSRMIDSFVKGNCEKTGEDGSDAEADSRYEERRKKPDHSGEQGKEGVHRQRGTMAPSYYKPGSKNPKLAEQMQKRKLLWQGTKEKAVSHSWETMLAACTDTKQAEKLKKMIGMRGENQASTSAEPTEVSTSGSTTGTEAKRQEEIARNLQQQYELARMSTHTHRGMGLGFTSQMFSFTVEQPAVAPAETRPKATT